MKLGIYGGSFDPIHWGHLMLAECCRESLELDQVWFIPAHQPPHKQDRKLSSPEHRQQMLLLATAGNPAFHVSNVELERPGTSYTVDTIEQIHLDQPTAELFLLMGADTLRDLPNWRTPARICELAQAVVVHRGGQAQLDPEPVVLPSGDTVVPRHVQMPLIELSSTEVRERVRTGRSIRYRTTAAVEQYIRQHGLYAS